MRIKQKGTALRKLFFFVHEVVKEVLVVISYRK